MANNGYSCMRRSRYAHTEVSGKWVIPTYYAGKFTSDSTGNIVPEMMFGFYDYSTASYGLDIGLVLTSSGKWNVGTWRSTNVCVGAQWKDSATDGIIFSLTPGETLYCKAWIAKSGSNYYSYFNVSRSSYTGTDILSSPCCWQISSTFGALMTTGYAINREIVIAANDAVASTYETSGCYSLGGKFQAHGLKTYSGVTYNWTDANSYAFTTINTRSYQYDSNGRAVIQLRKDGGTVNTNKINASRSDAATGAIETVNINFA